MGKQDLFPAATQVGLIVQKRLDLSWKTARNRTLSTRYDPPAAVSGANSATQAAPPATCVCTGEASLRGKQKLNASRGSDKCIHVVVLVVEVRKVLAM